MIDIENAKMVFKRYVSDFNPDDQMVKIKVDHTLRVANICKVLAEELNLDKERIKLAELIGIFHDIGRFKQARIYKTFSDKESGVDHAKMALEVLYEDVLIKEFNIDKKYDEAIKKAVLNHNKTRIDTTNMTEEELLFSKIVRDADKIDIYYLTCDTEYDFDSIFWYDGYDDKEIDSQLIESFRNHQLANYSKIKTNTDQIMIFYSYIYDFNFDYSLKYIYENEYLEKLTNMFLKHFNSPRVKEQVKELLEMSNSYIEEKLKAV